MILLRGFFRLGLSHTFYVFCFCQFYAKTKLSAESSFTFLHVQCIFFSLYIKGYVFIAI